MSPLANRVTPLSELIADPARGLVYGNRGCLHDGERTIRRFYNGKRWISCRLAFRGWHRQELMQPGKFTELFFLDEATAFAAGHRPCALCRRDDYTTFLGLWQRRRPTHIGADAIDAHLHSERIDHATRRRKLHGAPLASLPDGTFILSGGRPHAVIGDSLRLWTPAGYGPPQLRALSGDVELITPPSIVAILGDRWTHSAVPFMHPSAYA